MSYPENKTKLEFTVVPEFWSPLKLFIGIIWQFTKPEDEDFAFNLTLTSYQPAPALKIDERRGTTAAYNFGDDGIVTVAKVETELIEED